MTEEKRQIWATVELMGHVFMAGKITKPGEYGGLWQIDIPEGDGFRSEFFGSQSVYRIRIVSEEIARAVVCRTTPVLSYEAPIITREEHESEVMQLMAEIMALKRGLPEPSKKVVMYTDQEMMDGLDADYDDSPDSDWDS